MSSYTNKLQLSHAEKVTLRIAKVKDLRNLFVYLKQEIMRMFDESFLSSDLQPESIDDIYSLNGDELEDTHYYLSNLCCFYHLKEYCTCSFKCIL